MGMRAFAGEAYLWDMYIKSVHLENIRCIEQLDLAFEEGHEAGWHVLIGENGSGKTTVARAIALGLVPNPGANLLVSSWISLVRTNSEISQATFEFKRDLQADSFEDFAFYPEIGPPISVSLGDQEIVRGHYRIHGLSNSDREFDGAMMALNTSGLDELIEQRAKGTRPPWSPLAHLIFEHSQNGWFATGFGPVRRFKGEAWISGLERSTYRASTFASIFRDDASFTEVEPWLQKLYTQSLERKNQTLNHLRNFINHGNLLPNSVQLQKVTSDGVFFEDIDHTRVNLHDLSDGYRSVLSLTFELIRQLLRCYGEEKVFANVIKGEMNIPVPGVVIIDEVDAHLHPTWQTKIGQWFTRYFPKLQFIVTTHSPLVCRACGEHGKIFRLAAPGSQRESGEIIGVDRDRLVYGDILAAYETDAFGDKVEWGQEGRDLQKEYRDLAYKRRFGVELTEEETKQYERLKAIFKSHVEAD